MTRHRIVGIALSTVLVWAVAACGGDEPSGPGDFPDVRGTWVGQYSVVGCEVLTGTDTFFCDDLFYPGRSLLLDLTLKQSNARVFGVAEQGQLQGEVEGTVNMAGVVSLSGRIGVGADATTTIEAWRTQLVGDSLVGNWSFLVEDNTGAGFGSAAVDADLIMVGPSVPTFANCPVELTISQNDTLQAVLAPGDCQIENDESYFDVYGLDVQPGDRILFSLGSQEFSPALIVVDVEERLLGFEGDLADSVEVMALEAVVAETWLVIANSFLGGQLGTYTLSLQRLNTTGTPTTVTLQRVPAYNLRQDAWGGTGAAVPAGATASPSGSKRESLIRAFMRGTDLLKAEKRQRR
jgi:hypothetical protein